MEEMSINDPVFRNVAAIADELLEFIECDCGQCQYKIQCSVKYRKQIPVKIKATNSIEAHEYCFRSRKVINMFSVAP
jgi:hypothetical protein